MGTMYRITHLYDDPPRQFSFNGSEGPVTLFAHKVQLTNQSGATKDVEINKKGPDTRPELGEVEIESIRDSRIPGGLPTAKIAKKPYHGPSGGRGTFGSGGGNNPEREKRIVRQHSQEMAIRTHAIECQQGAPFSKSRITELIAEFDADVFSAGSTPPVAPVPVVESQPAAVEDDIPF